MVAIVYVSLVEMCHVAVVIHALYKQLHIFRQGVMNGGRGAPCQSTAHREVEGCPDLRCRVAISVTRVHWEHCHGELTQ